MSMHIPVLSQTEQLLHDHKIVVVGLELLIEFFLKIELQDIHVGSLSINTHRQFVPGNSEQCDATSIVGDFQTKQGAWA